MSLSRYKYGSGKRKRTIAASIAKTKATKKNLVESLSTLHQQKT